MRVSVLTSALALALVTTACSHAPEARIDAPQAEPADIAGIGPRPKVFGRHAWDAAQKRAAARLAQNQTAPAPAPTRPAPPVARPPAPAMVAQAPAAPPAPPVTAQPTAAAPAALAPAPVAMAAPVATPPAAPAPVAAEAPQPAKPAQVAQVAQVAKAPKAPDAPKAPKGPSLWQRITTPPPEAPVIAGGYGPAHDRDAVAAAAAFAVHESPGYVLKAVYSAKVQVVAGTNYSLCLWVRRPTLEPNPLHRRMVAATVFQGLDGHRELTAWKEVESCHAGAPAE